MERRWVGILLLLLAVVSLVAVQGLKGGRVAGNARAAPVSAPPQVGDCLLDPVDVTEAQTIYSQKPWATGPCADTWYGEVTAVIDTPDDPAAWPRSAGSADEATNVVDLAFSGCATAAYDYLGAVAAESPLVGWSFALRVSSVAIDPSPRQQTADQHWRACVVYLYPEESAVTAEAPAITQSLHDVLSTGAMTDALGICMSDAGLRSFDQLGCRQPHTVQIVALGAVLQPVQGVDLLEGCGLLTQQLTGRPELEADGTLDVDVHFVNFDQSGPLPVGIGGAEIPVGATAVCLIRSSGGRLLGGSLLGLGDRPIPWS